MFFKRLRKDGIIALAFCARVADRRCLSRSQTSEKFAMVERRVYLVISVVSLISRISAAMSLVVWIMSQTSLRQRREQRVSCVVVRDNVSAEFIAKDVAMNRRLVIYRYERNPGLDFLRTDHAPYPSIHALVADGLSARTLVHVAPPDCGH